MSDALDSTAAEPVIPDDLIRPGQAAKLLCCHLATVYRLFDSGRLPFWMVGSRQRRVSRRDVLALVQRGKAKRQVVTMPSVAEVEARSRKIVSGLRRHGLEKYLPEEMR